MSVGSRKPSDKTPAFRNCAINLVTLPSATRARSQQTFLRINYHDNYLPQITVSNRSGQVDFIAGGSVANGWTIYSYDWTCPAGINFASMALYAWGNTSASLFLNYVSCVPYAAVGQWGADVTNQHVLTTTASCLGGVGVPGNNVLTSLTGLGWTVTSSGASDVFNIFGYAVTIPTLNKPGMVTVNVYVDGNTTTSYGQGISPFFDGGASQHVGPFFGSVTGLSAGTHTIQIYAVNNSIANSIVSGWAICQRVY